MKKYRVLTDMDSSFEYATLDDALEIYERWKDNYMSDGVVENETYVELQESEDDFEDYIVVKKVIAVIDHDRHELGTPREEGMDWDYWAKWQEVTE
ncbi:MAG: hypothetical protein ACQET8_23385 [Bacillota bacterium]